MRQKARTSKDTRYAFFRSLNMYQLTQSQTKGSPPLESLLSVESSYADKCHAMQRMRLE